MLFDKVMEVKYLSGSSFEEWIHNPHKSVLNSSNVWKEMVASFSVIGDWLAWNIGNGKKI
jgi:hypothetical protein